MEKIFLVVGFSIILLGTSVGAAPQSVSCTLTQYSHLGEMSTSRTIPIEKQVKETGVLENLEERVELRIGQVHATASLLSDDRLNLSIQDENLTKSNPAAIGTAPAGAKSLVIAYQDLQRAPNMDFNLECSR